MAHRWKYIGLALRLAPLALDIIRDKSHVDVEDCLADVLAEWLSKAYNVTRFGEPSWKHLVEAVAHPAGGNDHALAERIAAKYSGKVMYIYMYICLYNYRIAGNFHQGKIFGMCLE